MEVASMTALALGFIFVGSANGEVAELILTTMAERTDEVLGEKWARFMALGLALLYVGECKLGLGSGLHVGEGRLISCGFKFNRSSGCFRRDVRDLEDDPASVGEASVDPDRRVRIRRNGQRAQGPIDASSLQRPPRQRKG